MSSLVTGLDAGLAEELVEYLSYFEDFLVVEPSSEKDLVLALYIYLKLLDFDVVYEGGKGRPDLVVRSRETEIPIEVKKADTASAVDRGIEQLFDYMKGTEWKKGILFVLDASKSGVAYSRAKEEESVTKYGRTVYVVAARMKG